MIAVYRLPLCRLVVLLFTIIIVASLFIIAFPAEGGDISFRDIVSSSKDKYSYGVIMDAGSTGTRLFLYKWLSETDEELINILPVLDENEQPVVKKVYPGLSTYQDKPSKAAEYIRPLLDYATSYIPEEKRKFTPLFLFATAGMRLVPEIERNAIIADLHAKLPLMTDLQVMKEHIKVIDGKWEGIYSWIAVNYILGRFNYETVPTMNTVTPTSIRKERKPTVGMIDMGGASCQIAFELNRNDSFLSLDVETINLGCRDNSDRFKYKMFVTTFLGYGVNEGLRRYEQFLSDNSDKQNSSSVRDPCLPVNLLKTVERDNNTTLVRRGSGSWTECVNYLTNIISNHTSNTRSSICQPQCFFGSVAAPKIDLSAMTIYGFSEFWYSLHDVFSLGGKYIYDKVVNKAKDFCTQRWSSIQILARKKLYPKADQDRLRTQCFKSAWITSVLHSGFGISKDSNNFESANVLDKQEVQWALGAMIYNLRYYPLTNHAVLHKERAAESELDNSFIEALLVFFLIATLLALSFYAWSQKKQMTKRYRRIPTEESFGRRLTSDFSASHNPGLFAAEIAY